MLVINVRAAAELEGKPEEEADQGERQGEEETRQEERKGECEYANKLPEGGNLHD